MTLHCKSLSVMRRLGMSSLGLGTLADKPLLPARPGLLGMARHWQALTYPRVLLEGLLRRTATCVDQLERILLLAQGTSPLVLHRPVSHSRFQTRAFSTPMWTSLQASANQAQHS